MDVTKECKTCGEELPLDNFYRSKLGYYTSYCKPCHIARCGQTQRTKYVKRPTGIAKLEPETRELLHRLAQEGVKPRQIAEQTGIPYARICGWIRTGALGVQ